MKGFFAVYAREVRRSRNLLIAFLVAAVVEFPLALFIRGFSFSEGLSMLAVVFATALGLGTTLAMGATILAPDLARGRIAFDLSRPVSDAGLFLGRMGSGLTVSILAVFLPLLPAFLAGDLASWTSIPNVLCFEDANAVFSLWELLGLTLGVTGLVFLLSHAASTMARGHSPRILLDVLAATLLASCAAYLLHGFLLRGMEPLLLWSLLLFTVLLTGGLLVGSYLQGSLGRVDGAKGHGLLSMALWGVLLLGTLGVWGLQQWALHPSFAAITGTPFFETSATGKYFTVLSRVRGRGPNAQALFLGKAGEKEPKLLDWGMKGNYVRFSPDEKWAVLLGMRLLPKPHFRLNLVSLDPRGPVRQTDIRFEDQWPLVLFSDDSRSLLIVTSSEARLLRFPSLDQEASVRLPGEGEAHWFWGGRFMKDGTVLLLSNIRSGAEEEGSEMRLWRWNPSQRKLEKSLAVGKGLTWAGWLSPDGDRFIARAQSRGGRYSLTLFDTSTGNVLCSLAPEGTQKWASFLQDGRFVALSETGGGRRAVLLCDRDGRVLHRIGLDNGLRLLPIGEISAGQMGFHGWFNRGQFERRFLVVYDSEANQIKVERDLKPAFRFFLAIEERLTPRPPEQAAWRRLCYDPSGKLVLLHPATGQRTPLMGL